MDKDADPDVTYDYYYNEDWQVLEVRKDSDADPFKQYVWDVRYIDAPAARFRDGNTDGEVDHDIYYMTDANFNVTALIRDAGLVLERYIYHPYGRVYVRDADFSADADGLSDYDNEILYAGPAHSFAPPFTPQALGATGLEPVASSL